MLVPPIATRLPLALPAARMPRSTGLRSDAAKRETARPPGSGAPEYHTLRPELA
jgi:hypothetical protein